jgi:hypothetical protein
MRKSGDVDVVLDFSEVVGEVYSSSVMILIPLCLQLRLYIVSSVHMA